jgi:hypothetical protein
MMRVLFLIVFTFTVFRWAKTWRRVVALTLVAGIASALLFPPPVSAQFGLIGGIQNIISLINGGIRSALSAIGAAMRAVDALYQDVVWPVELIDRARNAIAALIAEFRGLLQSLHDVRTSSATLPEPIDLEAVLSNRRTDDFDAVTPAYSRVFGSLPSEDDADLPTRSLVDMDDALALSTLKTLKASDQGADLVLDSGNRIENEARSAAPGSAPFLTAASMAANIQSQAMMQKMLAAMLRQEAARLAHENALRKQRSVAAAKLRQGISDVLIRR